METSSGALAVNLVGEIASPAPSTTPITGTTPTGATTTTVDSTPSAAPAPPATPPATTTTAPVTATTAAPAAVATLKLAGAAPVSRGHVAAVKLSCSPAAGASCAGTLTLTTKTKLRAVKKGRTVLKTRTVTVGSARYSVAQGVAATVKVTLSAAGRKLLDAAPHHKLKVTATAHPTAGSAPAITLTLTGAAAKASSRKKRR